MVESLKIMIFAHAFFGMIIAYYLLQITKSKLFPFKKMIVWISAITGSILPDLDIIYIFATDFSTEHRKLLSHSAILYILLFIVFLVVVNIVTSLNNKLVKITGYAFFLGIFGHLFLDMLTDDLYLLNPIYNKPLGLQVFVLDKSKGFLGYFRSPFMLMEAAISFFGYRLLIKSFPFFNKEFRILLIFTGIIEAGVIVAIIPFLYSFN